MKREHLEFFLDNKGYSLGFIERSSDQPFVAWMILSKRKPNERLLSILNAGEEPEFVSKQELYRERPYQVQRIEHRQDEPLLREVHYFRTLEEVEHYVADFGHTLENIKWLNEINPP
jgi:hypothetical protein